MLSNKTITAAQFRKQHCPSEYDECKAFHNWCLSQNIFCLHIPNENVLLSMLEPKHRAFVLNKLKSMGVVKGIPDYLVLINQGSYTDMLWIEMKSLKGKPTPDQIDVMVILNSYPNSHGLVCYGADQSMKFVNSYRKAA